MGPMRRARRLMVSRPSGFALVLRLGALVVLLAGIVPGIARAAPGAGDGSNAPRIYNKGRNFRIPFNLNPEGRDRVKELHLLVSEDLGYRWRPVSKTFPEHPTFTFRATHDGEFWFAVQTLTTDGKVSPPSDSTIEPNLKVVVDSLRPSLLLEPDDRRGSQASVRWEVKDENLDLKSLVLEYQVEGAGSWRRVPIKRPKLIGAQAWDAGTAEALKVKMSIADKAGNVSEAVIDLPEGAGSPAEMTSSDLGESGPPGISQLSGAGESEIDAGPDFTPVNAAPTASRRSATATGRSARQTRSRAAGAQEREQKPNIGLAERDSGSFGMGSPGPRAADRSPHDLFATPGGPGAAPSLVPQRQGEPGQPAGRDGGGTLLVASPRFKLQYAVDDAGPNGPATVELWITQDGGRTWIRRGEDSDRVSPIDVDLGGEGTYGVCLVARSASGLGDQPPAPGDPPQSWVEVDSTAPSVQLLPPQVGTGANSGKVAIAWRASDLHLLPKSVSLYWRPDRAGTAWQPLASGLEAAGQYVWLVPADVPQRFHLKVEAVDSVGHRGAAETTETGAIMVDRSRPRSRIIGLEPNARSGGAVGGTSLR